jgi:hypothetical protein
MLLGGGHQIWLWAVRDDLAATSPDRDEAAAVFGLCIGPARPQGQRCRGYRPQQPNSSLARHLPAHPRSSDEDDPGIILAGPAPALPGERGGRCGAEQHEHRWSGETAPHHSHRGQPVRGTRTMARTQPTTAPPGNVSGSQCVSRQRSGEPSECSPASRTTAPPWPSGRCQPDAAQVRPHSRAR